MEELIAFVLQVFLEVLVNVLGNGIVDWPMQSSERDRRMNSIVPDCVFWFVIAAAVGWASVLVVPNAWLKSPVLRLANMTLAPVISAVIAWWIARWRSSRHPGIVPRYYFWKSFWFTLGMVSVRFAYTVKA